MIPGVPYSGKFSREKFFVNYRLFAKILSANVFVDKDRAIALIHENMLLSRTFTKILSRENFPLSGNL